MKHTLKAAVGPCALEGFHCYSGHRCLSQQSDFFLALSKFPLGGWKIMQKEHIRSLPLILNYTREAQVLVRISSEFVFQFKGDESISNKVFPSYEFFQNRFFLIVYNNYTNCWALLYVSYMSTKCFDCTCIHYYPLPCSSSPPLNHLSFPSCVLSAFQTFIFLIHRANL